MSAAGQRWPRCPICGETRNHRHSCNDDWHRSVQGVAENRSADDLFSALEEAMNQDDDDA